MKRAYCILITGVSAGGKSTITKRLQESISSIRIKAISMDTYYKKEEERGRIAGICNGKTYMDDNHPSALDLDFCYAEVRKAMEGPFDLVIVEGLFSMHEERLLQLADLTVYVDCDPSECFARRVKRHLSFGQELEEITERYVQAVMPRMRELVEPIKWKADVLLNGFREDALGIELLVSWIKEKTEK